jgi:hypothetical protein
MRMISVRAISRRLRDESGVTVLLALFVLTVTTLILGAVYQAVTNDTQGTRLNVDQNRAYAAAQAGIAQYTYQLNQNPNYWQGCHSVTNVPVPGSTDGGSTEYYSYKPLPATTAPLNDQQCDTGNPGGTMIEGPASAAPGTFRIEVTGSSQGSSADITRSIVASFRQPSFLNYIYYTDYETLDPAALYDPSNNPAEPTDCAVHYPHRGSDCGSPIDFVTGDTINGPLHSEDTIAICGAPVFGRVGYNDAVEAPAMSTEGQGGCSNNAVIKNSAGALNSNAPSLTPPSTNSQLLSIATANGYVYTGRTTIVLNGTTMSVTNTNSANTGPTGPSVAWPSNGVIYVSTVSSGCGVTYTPFTANADYTGDSDCGNVYVSGNYTQSLTIASDNDIIINGNITTTTTGVLGTAPSGSQLLGLVANDFVRVYHPVDNRSGTTGGQCGNNAANGTGSLSGPYIYAAILAVSHSFIVDNYDCGAQLGTLTVWGAIAQLFRGPVGTIGNSGYTKSYNYDDRLAYSEPPYFLNPTSTAWYVSRSIECDNSC